MIKFDVNIFLLAKSLIYLMEQKYLGYHYLVIYDKLLKHYRYPPGVARNLEYSTGRIFFCQTATTQKKFKYFQF